MTSGIVLSLVASVFTAGASVAQRAAAAPAPGELRFSWRLIVFLLRRPVWFLGIVCMIAAFGFQVAALHFAGLSLVQPVIASELLFVFAFLAVRHRGRVKLRDWAAATGMALALAGFLYLASPHGGSVSRPGGFTWFLAAMATVVGAGAAAGLAVVRLRSAEPTTAARKAAMLAMSAAVIWGFVDAVIKEFSAQAGHGAYALLTGWSPYVLVVAGSLGFFLVSNAFQAGPLAASQPALTITEPVIASILGITLFGEHLRHGPLHLAGEVVSGLLLVVSVVVLSRSPLIAFSPEVGPDAGGGAAGDRSGSGGGSVRGGHADRPGRAGGHADPVERAPEASSAGPVRRPPTGGTGI